MKKRKLCYPGDGTKTALCSLKTYLKAQKIIAVLWMKRQGRRIKKAAEYTKYTLILIPAWGAFLMISFCLGERLNFENSIVHLLWEYKADFFTSVIIAAAISLTVGFEKSNKALVYQHSVYVSMMNRFSQFFKEAFSTVTADDEFNGVIFWPYYIKDDTWQLARKKIENIDIKKISPRDKDKICRCIQRILFYLNNYKADIINISKDDVQEIFSKLCDVEDDLTDLERTFSDERLVKNISSAFLKFMDASLDLIDMMRSPWRKDIEAKKDFLTLLYSDDSKMHRTYYDDAFLGIIDYEFYRNCSAINYGKRRFFEYLRDNPASISGEKTCVIEIPYEEYERIMHYEKGN